MCTRPLKTTPAIVPPMSAAAMLSRKEESTKTIASSANAPFQSPGRYFGSAAGTLLSSKCFDRSAKPMSRQKRLASSTHSCPRCATNPAIPGPVFRPVTATL